MLKILTVIIPCLLWASGLFAHEGDSLLIQKDTELPEVKEAPKATLVESKMLNDSVNLFYVNSHQLFEESWDELAHPSFWKTIMRLSPDSCIINIGATREVIKVFSVKDWEKKSKTEQDQYRDSVRYEYCLEETARIFKTTGKNDFYKFDNILPTISRGVEIFNEQNVDPWYAQTILMIESPGQLAKSNAGAYGSFQLMPGVARKFGLTVNRHVDERKDFDKSAVAASQLIETVCIPQAKRILEKNNLSYKETDLWFRLFVMHVYHAGAYNVEGVVDVIAPEEGGMSLIKQMWITKSGRFGNASQNYSQLALAVMMVLDDMLWDCYVS